MGRPTPPCFRCKDNHAECKKTCEEFKEWEVLSRAYREKVNKAKRLENDLAGLRMSGCENARAYARKMKGRNS